MNESCCVCDISMAQKRQGHIRENSQSEHALAMQDLSPVLPAASLQLVVAREQQAAEIREIRGDIVKAEWGQQIRNYVFFPYKLVKDTRTGLESADFDRVLDGDLDAYMEAFLHWRAAAEND